MMGCPEVTRAPTHLKYIGLVNLYKVLLQIEKKKKNTKKTGLAFIHWLQSSKACHKALFGIAAPVQQL